ncbi:SemiSWEET family sugar transporter [Flagellimonas meishanensis]|uniref:SemiSWEET family sugar transporter n=1 Tax=Flagellimonas meishanensis TaxID=2873264 RepID=UPI001CA6BA13|nr:SemiSWEET transporter [[Muricauda] meishanensis]
MDTIEILGLVAATLTTSAFVPQVYKALKHKSTADVSLTMYIVLLIGLILWIFYGVYHNSLSIILANVITGILALTMLILKLKHK